MSDIESGSETGKGRKRKRNEENWKRNKIKISRLKGEQYTGHAGNLVEAKTIGAPCG